MRRSLTATILYSLLLGLLLCESSSPFGGPLILPPAQGGGEPMPGSRSSREGSAALSRPLRLGGDAPALLLLGSWPPTRREATGPAQPGQAAASQATQATQVASVAQLLGHAPQGVGHARPFGSAHEAAQHARRA